MSKFYRYLRETPSIFSVLFEDYSFLPSIIRNFYNVLHEHFLEDHTDRDLSPSWIQFSRVFSSFLFSLVFVFSFVLALSLHFPFKKFIGYFLPFLFIFTKEKTIQLLQLETAEMYRHKSVQAVSPGRFV